MELRAVARGVRVPLRSLRDLGRHRDPERGQRRPPPDDLLAGDDLHLQQGGSVTISHLHCRNIWHLKNVGNYPENTFRTNVI